MVVVRVDGNKALPQRVVWSKGMYRCKVVRGVVGIERDRAR